MTQQELETSILELTNQIREEQPLVYIQLMENISTLPDKINPDIRLELEQYYNTLKSIISKN